MKTKLLAVILLLCLTLSSCQTGNSSETESHVNDTTEVTNVEETTEKKVLENTSETETESEEYYTYGWYEYETLEPGKGEHLIEISVLIPQNEVKKKLESTAEELSKPGEIVFYGGLDEKMKEYPEDTVFRFYISFIGSLPKDYNKQTYTDKQNVTRTLDEWREGNTGTYLIATEADYREHYIKYNKYFTEIGALTDGRCICFDGMYFYLYATLDQLLSYECAPNESLVVFVSPH